MNTESQQAMIFLETWGSTSFEPSRWETKDDDGNELVYAWSESDYFPEWLESELGHDANGFVTVLSARVGTERVPAGYRIAYSYGCGEKECPDCEGTGDVRNFDDNAAEMDPSPCKLCEGDGHIYWGEEWQVIVFAPRYSYGSGMAGCLYDNGPHLATSKDEAIEALVESFSGYFDEYELETCEADCEGAAEREEQDMRESLTKFGHFRFSRPDLAGADYCEIVDDSVAR